MHRPKHVPCLTAATYVLKPELLLKSLNVPNLCLNALRIRLRVLLGPPASPTVRWHSVPIVGTVSPLNSVCVRVAALPGRRLLAMSITARKMRGETASAGMAPRRIH